jgi:hypothetical protein
VPCDISVFQKLKLAQEGGIFCDISLIQKQSQATFAKLRIKMFENTFNSGAVARLFCIKLQGDSME